jgi:hypothetical protein
MQYGAWYIPAKQWKACKSHGQSTVGGHRLSHPKQVVDATVEARFQAIEQQLPKLFISQAYKRYHF